MAKNFNSIVHQKYQTPEATNIRRITGPIHAESPTELVSESIIQLLVTEEKKTSQISKLNRGHELQISTSKKTKNVNLKNYKM